MIAPSFTRSSDWWEPKITWMIGFGLMISFPYFQEMSFESVGFLLQLLLTLIIGAVYVSLINDYTDLEEDLAAGKANRLQSMAPWLRKALIGSSISILGIFIYALTAYPVGLAFFLASKVAYTMYSFEPFRLKSKGIWGVLADACGAHVFPTMGIFAFLSEYFTNDVNWLLLLLVGGWSFLYGIRGILGHQYMDRDHDILVGGKTFACQYPKEKIQQNEWVIVFFEVLLFVAILYYLKLYHLLLGLLVYLAFVWLIKRYTTHAFIAIIQASCRPNWNIMMAAYYQLIVPVSLMLVLALSNYWFLVGLVLFVMLFPNEWIKNLRLLKALYKSPSFTPSRKS